MKRGKRHSNAEKRNFQFQIKLHFPLSRIKTSPHTIIPLFFPHPPCNSQPLPGGVGVSLSGFFGDSTPTGQGICVEEQTASEERVCMPTLSRPSFTEPTLTTSFTSRRISAFKSPPPLPLPPRIRERSLASQHRMMRDHTQLVDGKDEKHPLKKDETRTTRITQGP